MRYLIILFLFSINSLSSQDKYKPIVYHKWDTTYTLQYYHSLALKKEIKSIEFERDVAFQKIELMYRNQDLCDTVIRNLIKRDSSATQIIKNYKTSDSIQVAEIHHYKSIIKDYNYLVLSSQEELKAKNKQAKKEKLWKNAYKYGYPAALILLILLLK